MSLGHPQRYSRVSSGRGFRAGPHFDIFFRYNTKIRLNNKYAKLVVGNFFELYFVT